MTARTTLLKTSPRALGAIALSCSMLSLIAGCSTGPVISASDEQPSYEETQALLDRLAASRNGDAEKTEMVGDPTAGELRANIEPIMEAEGEIIIDDNGALASAEDDSPLTIERVSRLAPPDLDEQIEANASELAILLSQRARNDEFGIGFGDLARLTVLDSIVPGIFNTYYLEAIGETPLTEAQRETLREWRGLVVDSVSEIGRASCRERV